MNSDEFDLHGGYGTGFKDADPPMKVTRGSYRKFSRWMTEELAKLVSRWAHTAAPSAQQIARRSKKGKPRKPR